MKALPSLRRRRVCPRGATLIEAMSALVVFTVGILGVLQMNVLASAQTTLAKNQTLATTIARDLVDAFERLPYDHVAFAPSASDPDHTSFIDPVNNPDTLHDLEDDFAPARPISSSAYATAKEIQKHAESPPMTVMWRVASIRDPSDPAIEEGKRIAIMIRYATPTGFRQTTVWTVKFNPAALVGAASASPPEI